MHIQRRKWIVVSPFSVAGSCCFGVPVSGYPQLHRYPLGPSPHCPRSWTRTWSLQGGGSVAAQGIRDVCILGCPGFFSATVGTLCQKLLRPRRVCPGAHFKVPFIRWRSESTRSLKHLGKLFPQLYSQPGSSEQWTHAAAQLPLSLYKAQDPWWGMAPPTGG